jgi:hypothetical protein
MKSTFSLVVNHTPWRPERVKAKEAMLLELLPLSRGVPFLLHDDDYRGLPWQDVGKVAWHLTQWRWAAAQSTTHHIFCTDDLHLAPRWWDVLEALVEAAPNNPIGLLSNHPRGPELAADGWRWYATNSWLVGPCYCLPHDLLVGFVAWYESLPKGPHTERGTQAWYNDDNSLNEFISYQGPARTLHPLPTIVEHRLDLESTVGHGDRHSRERLSWRARRSVRDLEGGGFEWVAEPHESEVDAMTRVDFWNEKGGAQAAPLLLLPG